jgi:nitrogen fixation/metabolism regulation signal transduction histidine kinase
MARRVAHEIKNPLTPLMLAVRQARFALAQKKGESVAEPLDVIEQEAMHLDEMARSFSQLGRLPEGPKSAIDIKEMLGDLLKTDLPASIEGILSVSGDVPLVEGHLEALNRAFRNLLGNAVDAVGGRTDGRIEVTITAREDYVEVAIADNGPGVASEHRDRLWDPDFTTKSRGTGLGLALVRQTVNAHGGTVELQNADEGASFLVRLPLTGLSER